MKKKNLAIFTVARSDFGIMKNIIEKCEKDKRFNLFLIIGPAHNSKVFGHTRDEINLIKVKKKINFKFKYIKSTNEDIINYFSRSLNETKKFLKKAKIDAALILGDRYEMLAISFVCLNYNIPIMHFCGGNQTLGSLDEIYRYAISKMAKVHFLETNHHKTKLKAVGIKKNLNVVGNPALENLDSKYFNKKELIEKFKFSFNPQKKIIVACFSPETTISKKNNLNNLNIMLKFLSKVGENLVFTYPNADPGFNDYINLINRYLLNKKNADVVKNLGIINYFSLLKISSLLIGNSSSGIVESSSFKIPAINLGDRQKGRFAPKNVIHSNFSLNKINLAYKKAFSKKFISSIKKIRNPYYKSNTSIRSLNLINKYLKSKNNL